MFQHRHLVVKRRENLTEAERDDLTRMREYLPELQALLLHAGVAVLAYDKRGIGKSGGLYPGESPTGATIDQLARDAAAAARFLTTRAEVDPARIGLAGHSQAGWIMPLAATREPGRSRCAFEATARPLPGR